MSSVVTSSQRQAKHLPWLARRRGGHGLRRTPWTGGQRRAVGLQPGAVLGSSELQRERGLGARDRARGLGLAPVRLVTRDSTRRVDPRGVWSGT